MLTLNLSVSILCVWLLSVFPRGPVQLLSVPLHFWSPALPSLMSVLFSGSYLVLLALPRGGSVTPLVSKQASHGLECQAMHGDTASFGKEGGLSAFQHCTSKNRAWLQRVTSLCLLLKINSDQLL